MSPRLLPVFTSALLAIAVLGERDAYAAGATLAAAKGDVKVRPPKDKSWAAVAAGAAIEDGARLKTGDDGEATLKFPDGTESKVRAKSEIIVRAPSPDTKQPGAVVVFFGRIWSKVAKASAGETTFEVRSANAVAGVRGTEFEVGVADDGSTRVIVDEGTVGVGGDEGQPVNISGGFEIESDNGGRLAGKKKAAGDPDWDGWFSKRARELEKNGLKVAKALDGRLNARKAKVEKLVQQQKTLRRDIEALERRKKQGADVDDQLHAKLEELERVTARLEDMKQRLQGAFGLFERWGAVAKKGGMDNAEQMGRMADNIAKVAADFADMIEEGTDLSEEGMDDMMKDMQDVKGAQKKQRPKQNAGDELF